MRPRPEPVTGSVNSIAEKATHEDVPAVRALGALRENIIGYRADQLAHTLNGDDAGWKDQESQMADHVKGVEQAAAGRPVHRERLAR